jgi:Allene oxide cyclase barrel like domain
VVLGLAHVQLPQRRRLRRIAIAAVLAAGAGGLVAAILSATGTGPGTSAAAATTRVLDITAVPTRRAFVDNADDRQRGKSNNPFGNYGALDPATTDERRNGPFPGDEGLFAYRITSGSGGVRTSGTAALACEYGFERSALCQASYTLGDGTLDATGSFRAGAKSFILTVTGGTGAYLEARGTLRATVGPGGGRSTFGLVLEPQRIHVSLERPRSGATTRLSSYSTARQEDYIHNGDDEVRGDAARPFPSSEQVAKAAARLSRTSPVPGDQALFQFAVYADDRLRHATGSGTFVCQYLFAGDAFCNATYVLPGGTMSAQGVFGLDTPTIALAVTGGTGRYRDASGSVETMPAGGHAQHMTFSIGTA